MSGKVTLGFNSDTILNDKSKKNKGKSKGVNGDDNSMSWQKGIVLLNNISTDIIGLLYVDLQTCPKNT